MKRTFKQLAALAAFLPLFHPTFAQDSLSRKKEANGMPSAFIVNVFSGSNGLNQYMMNKLAFGGFIPEKKILAQEDIIKKHNRAGLFSMVYLSVGLPQGKKDTSARKWRKFTPSYIALEQRNILGAGFDKGAWQLVFRGNDPYLGQTLHFGKTGYQQFVYRTASVGFLDLYKNPVKQTSFGMALGISQILAWRELKFSKGTLYTDPDRNYVAVQYSMHYKNSGRSDGGGTGVGLVTDWMWSKRMGRKLLSISLSNFGVAHVNSISDVYKKMDTVAQVKQSNVGFKTLNSNDWMEYFRDTINSALAPDTVSKSQWVTMPFMFQCKYYSKVLDFGIHYIFIRGYLPRLTVSPRKGLEISRGFSCKPALQFGGFDTYNVNLMLDYRVNFGADAKKQSLYASLGLYGLEAWALPTLEHGAGLVFSLHYYPN